MARAAQADLVLRGEVGWVDERLLVSITLINVADAWVMNIVSRAVSAEQLGAGVMGIMVARLFNRPATAAEPEPAPLPDAPPPAQRERLVISSGAWSPQVGAAAIAWAACAWPAGR